MRGQGRPHSLSIEIAVERKRPQRSSVRTLVVLSQPRIAVAQSPGRDRDGTGDGKYDVEIFGDMALHRGVTLGFIATNLHVVDIELGDEQPVAQVDDAA